MLTDPSLGYVLSILTTLVVSLSVAFGLFIAFGILLDLVFSPPEQLAHVSAIPRTRRWRPRWRRQRSAWDWSGEINQIGNRFAPQTDERQESFHVLGIEPTESADEIRAAYHRLAQTYHPDKFVGARPEICAAANHRMAEINAEYEKLTRNLAPHRKAS